MTKSQGIGDHQKTNNRGSLKHKKSDIVNEECPGLTQLVCGDHIQWDDQNTRNRQYVNQNKPPAVH